jgi:hypothetical protein
MRIPMGCGVSNKENIVAILKEALGDTIKIAFTGMRFKGWNVENNFLLQ